MLEALKCGNFGKVHKEDLYAYKYMNDHTKTIAVK